MNETTTLVAIDHPSIAVLADQNRLKAAEVTEIDELNCTEANGVVVSITDFLKQLEEARVTAVKPHLDEQRRINTLAKTVVGNLESERTRLNRLLGDHGALLAARARAEQQKLLEEQTARERETADAVASAETVEEVDEIRERASIEAAKAQIAVENIIPTVKIKEDWDIEVVDAAALYDAHPEAVELKPRLSIIKALANAHRGALPGVLCKKVNIARR